MSTIPDDPSDLGAEWPTPGTGVMMDKHYLLLGLNALSRAPILGYFEDGHRGGAIVSAYYFCRENDIESEVPRAFETRIDACWANTDLCAPFPAEPPRPDLLPGILEVMAANMSGLRQAGHNVILPTLALKAFRDVPEAATESRVDGIRRLVECFTVSEVPLSDAPVDMPSLENTEAFARFVMKEFVECAVRFDGRGHGWTGHLLTHAMALLDLHSLGYASTAAKAMEALSVYIRRIRMGPQETDIPRVEHPRRPYTPLQKAYWQDRGGDWALGHVLKYPYGYYGLIRHLRDDDLRERCQSETYRIF